MTRNNDIHSYDIMKKCLKIAITIIAFIFLTNCSNGKVSQINIYEKTIIINFSNGNSESYIKLNELERQISNLKDKGDLVTEKFVFGTQGSYSSLNDLKIINEKEIEVKRILDKYNLAPIFHISQ